MNAEAIALHPKGDGMDGDSPNTTLDIEQYIHVLRRQWRLITALTLIGLLAAVGFLTLAPREYTATTTLNLTVISTEPFAARSAPSSLLDDQEERAIAQSHVVAVRAAELLSGEMTASEIREASSVSSSSGPAVVAVGFTANSPERATDGADAVASAYLSYRRDRADERIGVLVDSLDTRIDDLEGQVASIDDTLATTAADSTEFARHSTERQQLLTELDDLLAERNGLQSVDTTAGFVLSAAADDAVYAAPSKKLALLTGLGAGFVLGVLAAFVRNPRDRHLRTAAEVARALGAPVLSQLDATPETIPARGEDADALRIARERMLVDVGPGDTVVVIDASHEPRLSSTALNLAVVTAQSGHQVQMIAPEDPRSARHRLSDVIEPGENRAAMPASDGDLHFFDGGDARDEAQRDLLITRETIRAIGVAEQRTLTFLMLTTEASPASLLAALRVSQAAVLVTRERATTTTEVAWLRQEASGTGTAIIGAVIESARRAGRGDGRRAPSHAERRETVRHRDADRSREPVSAAP